MSNNDDRELVDAAYDEVEAKRPATTYTVEQATADTADTYNDSEITEHPRKSQATQLVELVRERVELFHDGDSSFATLPVENHQELYALRSRSFRRWLGRLYFEATQRSPNREAVVAAIATLEGFALFEGDKHKTALRIANADSKLYLDLCDDDWRVVEINTTGWRIVHSKDAPVWFRRAPAMLPLPEPQHGGYIGELRPFLNVASDDDFRLIVSWLLAALRDRGPYPVLILTGEQGSAKSTTARMLRSLVDPNEAPTRSVPRDERDLMIAARNGQIVNLDNLTRLPDWLSDALCRLSTGAGFSTRTLYSDDEETIFAASRPIVINAIGEIATRGDLLDRSIILTLPPLRTGKRQTEAEFNDAFEAARPLILGALLDAVSAALRNVATTNLDSLPRMADFATWVEAGALAFGWQAGEFVATYCDNIAAANTVALSGAVGAAVQELRAWGPGTMSELLEALTERAGDRQSRSKEWPKSARALSEALRRITPNLREIGLEIAKEREAHTRRRLITITPSENTDKPSSPRSPSSPNNANPKDRELFAGDKGGRETGRQPSPASPDNIKELPPDSGSGDGGNTKIPPLSDVSPAETQERAPEASENGWTPLW